MLMTSITRLCETNEPISGFAFTGESFSSSESMMRFILRCLPAGAFTGLGLSPSEVNTCPSKHADSYRLTGHLACRDYA